MGFTQDTPSVYLTHWPNWEDGVRVSYLWRTGVLTTISAGKEQRSCYLSQFLRKMQFELTNLSYGDSNRILRNLQRYVSLPWGVPLFTDAIQLSAPVIATDMVLPLSARVASLNFVAGQKLIILDPEGNPTAYEVATISSIGADSITVSTGLTSGWDGDCWVCPLILGFVNKEDILYLTSEYSSLKLAVTELSTGVTQTETATTTSTTTSTSTSTSTFTSTSTSSSSSTTTTTTAA